MPTITVNKLDLEHLAGQPYSIDDLSTALETAKAEIDAQEGDTLRIQLKDTNRPDLWSTEGLARLLKSHRENSQPDYSFFNHAATEREVIVDPGLLNIRPYIAAFACEGIQVDEATLEALIEAQEKLADGYGRGRSAVAIGIYDASNIEYPVRYEAADPDTTTFIPLDFETAMTLRQILSDHPTGKVYAHLLEGVDKFPLIRDARGEVLSMPPVINSQGLGRVEVGDTYLFCEATGPELDAILLAMAIMAVNMADRGGTIHPVTVQYPYDTPRGQTLTCPFDMTTPLTVDLNEIQRVVGSNISIDQIQTALNAMGYRDIDIKEQTIHVLPAPYRDDILHPVDIVEDVVVGIGYEAFEPEMPRDFTIGKAAPQEDLSDKFRNLMVGSGFQEVFLPILCSQKEQSIEMNNPNADIVSISNPMSENYSALRGALLPGLLKTEGASRRAVYPHRFFEVGEVAVHDPDLNYGTRTDIHLGALEASDEANLSGIQSYLEVLAYYFHFEYTITPIDHPTFLPGRVGEICIGDKSFGLVGEIHPSVLETWGINYPTSIFEVDIRIAEQT
jgi:phenylalanyl-tRNA synthetase beta chain